MIDIKIDSAAVDAKCLLTASRVKILLTTMRVPSPRKEASEFIRGLHEPFFARKTRPHVLQLPQVEAEADVQLYSDPQTVAVER